MNVSAKVSNMGVPAPTQQAVIDLIVAAGAEGVTLGHLRATLGGEAHRYIVRIRDKGIPVESFKVGTEHRYRMGTVVPKRRLSGPATEAIRQRLADAGDTGVTFEDLSAGFSSSAAGHAMCRLKSAGELFLSRRNNMRLYYATAEAAQKSVLVRPTERVIAKLPNKARLLVWLQDRPQGGTTADAGGLLGVTTDYAAILLGALVRGGGAVWVAAPEGKAVMRKRYFALQHAPAVVGKASRPELPSAKKPTSARLDPAAPAITPKGLKPITGRDFKGDDRFITENAPSIFGPIGTYQPGGWTERAYA